MPPKRKVKQAARATLAKAACHSRESAVLGVPPPPTSVHFEDAEELQEILAEVTARPAVQDAGASLEAVVMANGHPSQVAWEQQVDAHLANTERLLLEMMCAAVRLDQHPVGGVDRPAPSTAMHSQSA